MKTIEAPESSSPIVTRAVAAGLDGEFCDNYHFPGWQKFLLNILGAFPAGAARFAISRFEAISGLPPEVMDNFSLEDMLHLRLADYDGLQGQFPAITVGAALGGATTWLSVAMGGPFLPQAFVVTLKKGSKSGDVNEYLQRSLAACLKIADENPGVMTIQHYDPVHDGWMTRFVNHVRIKIIKLPHVYKEFIKSRLEPGGSLVFLDGGATWLRYRVGPRSVFQVGGWGDISPEEFLEGSGRLRTYASAAGLRYTDWKLKGYPLERGPESEWGSEPGLPEALEEFCKTEGYRFVRISLSDPNDFSGLAFQAALMLLKKEYREPAGTLVEMFSQFDTTSAFQSGLLPLWLIFNTRDSARYLAEMSPYFPKDKPVFFSPLATFSLPPDKAEWDEWVSALARRDWINIGTRPSHYPGDARALVQWADPLRKWVEGHRNPILSRMTAEELAKIAQKL